jgi:hypothetical protein
MTVAGEQGNVLLILVYGKTHLVVESEQNSSAL